MQRINVQRIRTMNSLHVRMLVAVTALFCSPALVAQNASFTGHVTDATGAVVRGARIVVHDQNTNVESSTVTNSAGVYEVPYLNPDKYTLTVSSPGFKMVSLTNIELDVAQVAVLDFKLDVGSVSQSITVNGDESLLDRGTGTRGEVVENTRVTELPLNGRNPVMLDRLNSAVLWNGNLIWQRPFDGQVWTNLDINGSGNYNTEIMLDGQPDQTPRPQNGAHQRRLCGARRCRAGFQDCDQPL